VDTTQLLDEGRQHVRHLRLAGLVGAFVDGELTDRDLDEVAEHVANCWACSGYAETVRLVKSSLRRRPGRAPAALAERRLLRFAQRLLQHDDEQEQRYT
jgi:anti-sigma factor RsiW